MYYIKSATGAKQAIKLSAQLGKGGQATVYKLSSPSIFKDDCVKIYLDISKFQRDRIEFMIANPPHCSDVESTQFRICWPKTVVYDSSNRAVGYIMPLAFPKSRDLKILDFYAAGKSIADHRSFKDDRDWHNKYERYDKKGLVNRMKMMHNWALAVYRIHSVGRYVIIDIKPENILATSDGRISIVDTDSFQITNTSGAMLFNGPAFTEDYFPKIAYTLKQNNRPFTIECDLFALSVIFYKILIGVHPYAGVIKKSPYTECNTIREAIENDLFAFGDRRSYLTLPPNSIHNNLSNIPVSIQRMFSHAFAIKPQLPTAKEWITTLKSEIVSISSGKVNIVAAKKLPKATKPKATPKRTVSQTPSRPTTIYNPPPTGRTAARMTPHPVTYGSRTITPAGRILRKFSWSHLNSVVTDWGDDLSYDIDDYVEKASRYTVTAMWLIFAISVISTVISEGVLTALVVGAIMGVAILTVGGIGVWLIEKATYILLISLRFVLYNIYTLLLTIIFVICAVVPWDNFKDLYAGKAKPPVVEVLTPNIASLPTTKYYCTARSGLNVREKVSATSKIVGLLPYNQEVDVYKIEGDVAQVIFNDTICFASSSYLKLKQ